MKRQDWVDLAWWICFAGAYLTAMLMVVGLGQTLVEWSARR